MRTVRLVAAVAVMAAMSTVTGCSDQQTSVSTRETQVSGSGRVLRHAVFFKFKDSSSPEDVQRVVDAFRALPGRIDVIKGFEWGVNNSPEGHDQGCTHAFLLTFDSEAGRDAYLPHPAHKDFGKIAGPHIEKVFVVDYWAQK